MPDFNSKHSEIEDEFSEEVSGHDYGLTNARLSNLASLLGQNPFGAPTTSRNMKTLDLSESVNVDLENSNFNSVADFENGSSEEEMTSSVGIQIYAIKEINNIMYASTESGIFRRENCVWSKVGEYLDGADASAIDLFTPVGDGFFFWFDDANSKWHMRFNTSGVKNPSRKWIGASGSIEFVDISVDRENGDILLATKNHGVYFYNKVLNKWTKASSETNVEKVFCGNTSLLATKDNIFASTNRCHSFELVVNKSQAAATKVLYVDYTDGIKFIASGNNWILNHYNNNYVIVDTYHKINFNTFNSSLFFSDTDKKYSFENDGIYYKTRSSLESYKISNYVADVQMQKFSLDIQINGQLNVGDIFLLETSTAIVESVTSDANNIYSIGAKILDFGYLFSPTLVTLGQATKISNSKTMATSFSGARFIDTNNNAFSMTESVITSIPLDGLAYGISDSHILIRNGNTYGVIKNSPVPIITFQSDNKVFFETNALEDLIVIFDGSNIYQYNNLGALISNLGNPITNISSATEDYIVAGDHSIFETNIEELATNDKNSFNNIFVTDIELSANILSIKTVAGINGADGFNELAFKKVLGDSSWTIDEKVDANYEQNFFYNHFGSKESYERYYPVNSFEKMKESKNDSESVVLFTDSKNDVLALGNNLFQSSVKGYFKSASNDFYFYGDNGINKVSGPIKNESLTYVFDVDIVGNTATVIAPFSGIENVRGVAGLSMLSAEEIRIEEINQSVASQENFYTPKSTGLATGDYIGYQRKQKITVLDYTYGDNENTLFVYDNYTLSRIQNYHIPVASITSIVGNVITFSRDNNTPWPISGRTRITVSLTETLLLQDSVTSYEIAPGSVSDEGNSVSFKMYGLPAYNALKNYSIYTREEIFGIKNFDPVTNSITITTKPIQLRSATNLSYNFKLKDNRITININGYSNELGVGDTAIIRVATGIETKYVLCHIYNVDEVKKTTSITTFDTNLSDVLQAPSNNPAEILYSIFKIPDSIFYSEPVRIMSSGTRNTNLYDKNITSICETPTMGVYANAYGNGILHESGTSFAQVANIAGTNFINKIANIGNTIFGVSNDFVFKFVPSSAGIGTWTKLTVPLSSSKKIILTDIATFGTNTYIGTKNHGIYNSQDLGVTWNKKAVIDNASDAVLSKNKNLLASKDIGIYSIDLDTIEAKSISSQLPNEKVIRISSDSTKLTTIATCAGKAIFLSKDGFATWTRISIPEKLVHGYMAEVSSNYQNDKVICVYNNEKIHITKNDGVSWLSYRVGRTKNLVIENSVIITDVLVSLDFGLTWKPIALTGHSIFNSDEGVLYSCASGNLNRIDGRSIVSLRQLDGNVKDIEIRRNASVFDFGTKIISGVSAETITGTILSSGKSGENNVYTISSSDKWDYAGCFVSIYGSADGRMPIKESVDTCGQGRCFVVTDGSFSLSPDSLSYSTTGITKIVVEGVLSYEITDGSLIGLHVSINGINYRICKNFMVASDMVLHLVTGVAIAPGSFAVTVGSLENGILKSPNTMFSIINNSINASFNFGLTQSSIDLNSINIDSVQYDVTQLKNACNDDEKTYILFNKAAITLGQDLIENSVQLIEPPYIESISTCNNKIWGLSNQGVFYIPNSSWGISTSWTQETINNQYISLTGSRSTFDKFASDVFQSRHSHESGFVYVAKSTGEKTLLFSSDFGNALFRECEIPASRNRWDKTHIATSPMSAQLAVYCDGSNAYVTMNSARTWTRINISQNILFADFDSIGNIIMYAADGNVYRHGSDGLIANKVTDYFAHFEKTLIFYDKGATLFVDDSSGKRVKHFSDIELHKTGFYTVQNSNKDIIVYGVNKNTLYEFDFETEQFDIVHTYESDINSVHYINNRYNVATNSGIFINNARVERFGNKAYLDFIQEIEGDHYIDSNYSYFKNGVFVGRSTVLIHKNNLIVERDLASGYNRIYVDKSTFYGEDIVVRRRNSENGFLLNPNQNVLESPNLSGFMVNAVYANVLSFTRLNDTQVAFTIPASTILSVLHIKVSTSSGTVLGNANNFEISVGDSTVVTVSNLFRNTNLLEEEDYTELRFCDEFGTEIFYKYADIPNIVEYRDGGESYVYITYGTITKTLLDFEQYGTGSVRSFYIENLDKRYVQRYVDDAGLFPASNLAFFSRANYYFRNRNGTLLLVSDANGFLEIEKVSAQNEFIDSYHKEWIGGWTAEAVIYYIGFGIPIVGGYDFLSSMDNGYYLSAGASNPAFVEHRGPIRYLGPNHAIGNRAFWITDSNPEINYFPDQGSLKASSTPSKVIFSNGSLAVAWVGSELFPSMTVAALPAAAYKIPAYIGSITFSKMSGRPEEPVNCIGLDTSGNVIACGNTASYIEAVGSWNIETYTGLKIQGVFPGLGGYGYITEEINTDRNNAIWSDASGVYLINSEDTATSFIFDSEFGFGTGNYNNTANAIGSGFVVAEFHNPESPNNNVVNIAFDNTARRAAIIVDGYSICYTENYGKNWFRKEMPAPCRGLDLDEEFIAIAVDAQETFSMRVDVSGDGLLTTTTLPIAVTGPSAMSTLINGNTIYIGTEGNGVWTYNRTTQATSRYFSDPGLDINQIEINAISQQGNNLYIATENNGVIQKSDSIFQNLSNGIDVSLPVIDIDAGKNTVLAINGTLIKSYSNGFWSTVGTDIVNPYSVFIERGGIIKNSVNIPANSNILILKSINNIADIVPSNGIFYITGQSLGNANILFNGLSDATGIFNDVGVIKKTVYLYTIYIVSEVDGIPSYTPAPRLHLGEVFSFDSDSITEIVFKGFVDGVTYREDDDTTIVKIKPTGAGTEYLLGTNLVGKTITIDGIPYIMEYCYKDLVYLPGNLTASIIINKPYIIDNSPANFNFTNHLLNPNIKQLESFQSGDKPVFMPISLVESVPGVNNVYSVLSLVPGQRISNTPGIHPPALIGFSERVSTLFEVTSMQRLVPSESELIYVADELNQIYLSSDNGKTFSLFASATNRKVNDIDFDDSENLFIATPTGLYKYISGVYTLILPGDYKGVFASEKSIVAISFDGEIHYSSDGGLTFLIIHDINKLINSVIFVENEIDNSVNYLASTQDGLYSGHINNNFSTTMTAIVTTGNIVDILSSGNKPGDKIYQTKNMVESSNNHYFGYPSNAEIQIESSSDSTITFKALENGIASDVSEIFVGGETNNSYSNPFVVSNNSRRISEGGQSQIVQFDDNRIASCIGGELFLSDDANGLSFSKIDNPLLSTVNGIAKSDIDNEMYVATGTGILLLKKNGRDIKISSHQGSPVNVFWNFRDSIGESSFIGGDFGLVISRKGLPQYILTPATFDPSNGISISWGGNKFDRSSSKNGLSEELLQYFEIRRPFTDYTRQPPADVLATQWAGTVVVRSKIDNVYPKNMTAYEARDRVHPEPIRSGSSNIAFPPDAVIVANIKSTAPNNVRGLPEYGIDTFYHDIPFVDRVSVSAEQDREPYGAGLGQLGAPLVGDEIYSYNLYPYYERPPFFVFQSKGGRLLWSPVYTEFTPEWFHYTISIDSFAGATKITCGDCSIMHDEIIVGTDSGLFWQSEMNGFALCEGTTGLYVNDIIYNEVADSYYIATNSGIFTEGASNMVFTNTGITSMAYKFEKDSEGRILCGTEKGIFALSSVGWVFDSVAGSGTSLANSTKITQKIR